MRKIFTCLVVFLLVLSTSTLSNDGDVPWLVSWPFFQNAQAPHSINGGYGDWCDIEEGAHPGLDFGATTGDSVLVPSGAALYAIGIYSGPLGYSLVFGTDSIISQEGWGVAHLYIDDPLIWVDSIPKTVTNHEPLAPCLQYGTPPTPLHMHLQWVDNVVQAYPPGLHNPFDYFANNLSGYDEVQFNPVKWEEFLSPPGNRGIWFTPDHCETYDQILTAQGQPDQNIFQNMVSGAVDIAVAPFSAFQGISDHDSAGVYSVSYEILRQNPITLIYLPAAPGAGNFGERCLMQMFDELPFGDTDEFRAIYLDGNLPGNTDPQAWDRFESAYIVTNSRALDPASWTTGWDNVWIDPYLNDWTTGICQGAWDTFLANPEILGDPTQNSEAFFPDGRYAVKVTAVSHGSGDTGIDTLPVNDLSLPDPQVEGVVVDNFLPHIAGVAVYGWDRAASTCHLVYEGHWEDINPDEAVTGESVYLEQLRAELHRLQSYNHSNTLPSFCASVIPESFSQSSLEHDYHAERNRLSRDDSDVTGNLEPGCRLDDRTGQGRVDFLLAEISRVENRRMLVDFDTTKVLMKTIYGYLPDPGESLVLQVFYSEPIMIEDAHQIEVPGNLHFTGTIGNLIKWISLAHGVFECLPGGFRLPSTSDNTAGSNLESSNTLIDSSYVVHYIFNGTLPQEYIGNVQLFFGNPDQPDAGPHDLAGNALDSYPGTVAEARNDYGPFSYNGFEAGPDTNHSWGVPDWDAIPNWMSPDSVIGSVGEDTIAVIHPAEIGLEGAWFIGDCDYWCGFWMYREEPGEYGFNIYVVKPNGSYIDNPFETPFPVGPQSGQEKWWFSHWPVLSPDSRYFWMLGGTLDWIDEWSDIYAYCVDSETGTPITYLVCAGHFFETGPPGCMACSHGEILNIYSNGIAQICYSYYTESNIGSCVSDTTLFPPPDGSDDILFRDICSASDFRSDAEEVIEILSNPVRETLGVSIIGVSGDAFELLLYDITGRQILSESGVLRDEESVLSIGVQSLPSGVYLLRITAGNAEVRKAVSIIH